MVDISLPYQSPKHHKRFCFFKIQTPNKVKVVVMFMLHLCIGKACNCVRGETGSVSKRMMPPTFEEMLTLASESLSLVFRGVGVVVVLAAAAVDFLAGPT